MRFTWAKAEANFKRRVEWTAIAAIHGAHLDSIAPGSKGRMVAERIAESLWDYERSRLERERREARGARVAGKE